MIDTNRFLSQAPILLATARLGTSVLSLIIRSFYFKKKKKKLSPWVFRLLVCLCIVYP